MNMLPPMNENAYRDHVSAIHAAAEVVCKESMNSASDETKQFYEVEEDGNYDIGISADGTWRRRGYSSSYGVVTGMSLVTGKVLDIEVMSKECRQCILWRGKEGTIEFEEWWEGHQHNSHANFEGSSGAMDAAGGVAIFQRSIEKDLAKGTTTYSRKNSLPQAVASSIHPVFEALTAEELLSSCLHGGTQNQNEAFNALIWQRAIKETHSSLPTVELATYLAVGHFNDGSRTLLSVLENLGIVPGSHATKACQKFDRDRVCDSRRKSSDACKKRRRQIRQKKKGYNETQQAKEGPKYEAGGF
ncbi:Hypothetical predicted protein [Paramuricea clavata]|uniref:Mutator-like transposase domain-containing protein n=1 Tax=Paramuricea clavata TaxID=317549 RepID=A0A6S7IXW9_PARCT|nr:Hypothetical predicted protein [Paramuricea clavata]